MVENAVVDGVVSRLRFEVLLVADVEVCIRQLVLFFPIIAIHTLTVLSLVARNALSGPVKPSINEDNYDALVLSIQRE